MAANWENPFCDFLVKADMAFAKAKDLPDVHTNPELMARVVQILEERNFISDIVVRVRCLSIAFDRMRDLYLLYRELEEEMTHIRRSCARHESIADYDNFSAASGKCREEAMMLTSFVYYEISSLVSLLRGCLQVSPGSSLEYLVAVRNKLLVHPQETSRIKNSNSAVSIGPMHAHLVGGKSWVPSVRKYYEQQLSDKFRRSLGEKEGEKANVGAILSPTRLEKLPDEARLLLKTYSIPEPNLLQSAEELAAELKEGFLKKVRHACARTS